MPPKKEAQEVLFGSVLWTQHTQRTERFKIFKRTREAKGFRGWLLDDD